ncbi:hypothetical protein PBCVKS1B_638L [Paramecium bursaria Chlorella virus KS1B]|nr:hypothetical protein PBCVKS1B_638L [Paramecium bursaria Chlorella virus KS1B]
MICHRCKKEHEEETKTCESCKENMRAYYAENLKKIRENQRTYHAENQESINKRKQTYYVDNSEKMKKKDRLRNATVHRKFAYYENNARKRSIPFDITEEFVGVLTDQDCFYCGDKTSTAVRNGIDRLDNTIGYLEENCRSCCGVCNNMKRCLDALTFVERCSQVSLHNGHHGVMCDFWCDIKGSSYSVYKRRNNHKDFQLTEEEYTTLRRGDCTYCGRTCTDTHTNGIDRVNNEYGYVLDNCVSACFDCNNAKKSLNVDDFIKKCVSIASKQHDIPYMPRCIEIWTQNRPKQK